MNSRFTSSPALPDRLQRATAFIDAAALRHNAWLIRTIAPQAMVFPVVKANAYGHGILATAEILLDAADGFAVANLEEALQLRAHLNTLSSGPSTAATTKPIVVLSALLDSTQLDICIAQGFTAVLHDEAMLKPGQFSVPEGLNYWIKVDTGMHRLGLSPDAATELLKSLPCDTLMTHYSSAEQADDQCNVEQSKVFNSVLAASNASQISLANSAALLRHATAERYQQWKDQHIPAAAGMRECLRPGIMLYGIDPLERPNATSSQLQPAMSFAAPIIGLRQIAAGERVGYCGTWTAERTSVIATVGAGYADGYPRHATSGTPVAIGQHRASLVGNVSMDTLAIDVTDLVDQGVNIETGAAVELWGRNVTADEVAQRAATISYTLFTSLSERIKRVYLNNQRQQKDLPSIDKNIANVQSESLLQTECG